MANNPVPFMPTIPSEYIDTFINDVNESMVLNQKEVLMGKSDSNDPNYIF